jgi:hypothetical protein
MPESGLKQIRESNLTLVDIELGLSGDGAQFPDVEFATSSRIRMRSPSGIRPARTLVSVVFPYENTPGDQEIVATLAMVRRVSACASVRVLRSIRSWMVKFRVNLRMEPHSTFV